MEDVIRSCKLNFQEECTEIVELSGIKPVLTKTNYPAENMITAQGEIL